MEIKINIDSNRLSKKTKLLIGGSLVGITALAVSLGIYNSDTNEAKREAEKAVLSSIAVQLGASPDDDILDRVNFDPDTATKDVEQDEPNIVKYTVTGTITEPNPENLRNESIDQTYEIEVHMAKRLTDGAWDRLGSITRSNK